MRVSPQLAESIPSRDSGADQRWLRAGYWLIAGLLVFRWAYVASGIIELSNDEAYQWLWSKHLALSYYSKPLGIALIQYVGTHLWGDTQLGVRFFAPLFAAVLSVVTMRFMAREASGRAAFLLLLIVTSTPLLGVGSVLMTVDSPLVLCWTLAMVAGWRAVQPEGTTRQWLLAGLATGLGFLCKYSAAYLVVCWAAFFLVWPPARRHLRKRGPWLGLLVVALCTLPVLIWNAQNHWITVGHVASNAGLDTKWHPTLRFLAEFLLSELGLLNPVWFVGACWAFVGLWSRRGGVMECWSNRVMEQWSAAKPHTPPLQHSNTPSLQHSTPSLQQQFLGLYLACMGWTVFLGHLAYSLYSGIQPNWIAPAVLPMFCWMVIYWEGRWREGLRAVKGWFIGGLVVGLAVAIVLHDTDVIGGIVGHRLPGDMDPLRRVRGYKATADFVESARQKLLQEGKPAFIICDHYGITGLFSFYLAPARAALHETPLVYYLASPMPNNQLYFWPEYRYERQRKGQNAIYVTEPGTARLERGWVWRWLTGKEMRFSYEPPPLPPMPVLLKEFETVTNLGVREIRVNGRIMKRVQLFECRNLK